ncbi:hypothetical protein LCGC14_0892820 [marine sediment metagenome]|uniref:Uncharacterized protein n=1 Tax=marine sediment metagenome TaxID=412755 RepID=A0A0F9NYQ6_9ZZZZ
MPISITTSEEAPPRFLDQLPVSRLTRRRAQVLASFDFGPVTEIKESIRKINAQGFDPSFENVVPAEYRIEVQRFQRELERTADFLTVEEANIQGKPFGLQYEHPLTQEALDLDIEDKKRRIMRQSLIGGASPGIFGKGIDLAMAFLGQAIDPLNIAVSFIPIVSQARAAAIANRLRLAHIGSRTVKGFIEGAVGNALIEPVVIAGENIRNRDYALRESAINILFGGFIGVASHQTLGRGIEFVQTRAVYNRATGDAALEIADELRRAGITDLEPALMDQRISERALEIIERDNPDMARRIKEPTNSDRVQGMKSQKTHETAVRGMLAQKLEGKLGDVTPIVERDPGYHRPFDSQEAKAAIEAETIGDVQEHAKEIVRYSEDPANTTGAGLEEALETRAKAQEPEVETIESVASDNELLQVQLDAATDRMRQAGGDEAVTRFEDSPITGKFDEPESTRGATVKQELDAAKARVAKNKAITEGIMRVSRECFGG